MTARIELHSSRPTDRVLMDGKPVAATRAGSRLVVDTAVSGSRKFTVEVQK